MIVKEVIHYALGSEEDVEVSFVGMIISCISELSLKPYREYRNEVKRKIQELYLKKVG